MRRICFGFIIAALMFTFCACGLEEMPENELLEKEAEFVQTEEPEEQPEEINKEALYEEMLLNFGAVKTEDGKIRANKTTSLYFKTDGFEDGTNLGENNYFSWAMFYFNREYSLEEREELFTGAGENMGWAYPSEYYEPVLYKYFGVTAETLRKGELYNAEKDFYHIGAGGGLGLVPYIVVNETEENAETVVFHITLDYEEYDDPCDMSLTVKLLPDGGYNYQSYLPE